MQRLGIHSLRIADGFYSHIIYTRRETVSCLQPRDTERTFILYNNNIIVFGGDNLMLNCKRMPNVCATSPDGYFEYGYLKATSDTCMSMKTLNYCTVVVVGVWFPVYSKCPSM